MVITTGTGASGTYDASALNELISQQQSLDNMGDEISKSMSDLHAMQDAFERAVKRQKKRLKGVSLSTRKPPSRSNATPEATLPNGRPPTSATSNDTALNGAVPNAAEPDMGNLPVHRNVHPAKESEPAPAQNGEPLPASHLTGEQFDAKTADLSTRLRKNALLMPATGGMFVELFLGSINVRFERKSERLNFKKEYEKLKLKLAPVFVVMCLICLFYAEYRWLHMVLQLALSCYYVTLAVRENILRANGSNIRPWWIIHHYFTMMQGVMLLTWPNGASYARYRTLLHLFGLYNSVLMIFQTRYQMARLYTLRSLGMANEMDVASSDSTQIHWSETMTLLLPLIVFGQLMQGYNAIYLLGVYREFPAELQILLLSLLFIANFIGNSTTTVQVLLAKRSERRRKLEARAVAIGNKGD